MLKVAEMDDGVLRSLGRHSRRLVEERYDEQIVVREYLQGDWPCKSTVKPVYADTPGETEILRDGLSVPMVANSLASVHALPNLSAQANGMQVGSSLALEGTTLSE